MKVIVAAAGTGGHINPGIAIANKIKEEEKNSEIIFIGTERGMEKDLVPRAGYELKTINSYGISRSLTIKNVSRFFKTLKSVGEAKKIIKEFRPDIIVGTGGYICVSVCMAAKKLGVPYVIHESNVLPGVATKMFSKSAKKIFVGFEETKKNIKNDNIIVTGTPTKIKKLNYDKNTIENKKQELGFDKTLPLVLVFGGSQGAQSINSSIINIIKKNDNRSYQILWASGPKQYPIIKEELEKAKIDINNIKGIHIKDYIYNMEEMMNICDLIVARSGAMTSIEIEKVGKPAILIPFPFAAENHQEYNARALENKGVAKVILDKDLNEQTLSETINSLISNKQTLIEMGQKAEALSINNVEDRIYVEIKEVVNNKIK